MTNETRRLIRDGFGAISDELRQRRATDTEILKRLEVIIKMTGGDNAKIQALREDHDAHVEKVIGLERRLLARLNEIAALAR